MKISPEELSELCDRQRSSGIAQGRAQKEVEMQAFVRENVSLRAEIASFASRAKHMEDAAAQRASFPAVRAEQLRVVGTVRKLLPKKLADDLLFLLAMGDIK